MSVSSNVTFFTAKKLRNTRNVLSLRRWVFTSEPLDVFPSVSCSVCSSMHLQRGKCLSYWLDRDLQYLASSSDGRHRNCWQCIELQKLGTPSALAGSVPTAGPDSDQIPCYSNSFCYKKTEALLCLLNFCQVLQLYSIKKRVRETVTAVTQMPQGIRWNEYFISSFAPCTVV